MKRKSAKRALISLILALAMVCTLAACGNEKPNPPAASGGTPDSSSPAENDPAAAPAELNYPEKEITCIIPYAPGGGTDNLTRAIASAIDLPKSMVCVTIEGASGMIGAKEAAASDNDGYTMLGHNPIDLICYYLSGGSEEKLWEELTPICTMVGDPGIVITSKDSGIKSVDDLKALDPEASTWGFVGTRGQMVAIQTFMGLGLDTITAVPYASGTDCITAVMGGHDTVASCNVGDLGNTVASGDVVPLMIIGDERCDTYPDIPCTGELGIAATGAQYRGYYVPAGTDEEIVKYLCGTMRKLSEDAEFKTKMEELGFTIQFIDYKETEALTQEWFSQFEPIYNEYCK